MTQEQRKGDAPAIPDWVVNYDNQNLQSGAGRAIRILMERDAYHAKELEALKAERDALKSALEELIQVKDWKDKNGKDEHYEKAQPLAWENARKAINNKP